MARGARLTPAGPGGTRPIDGPQALPAGGAQPRALHRPIAHELPRGLQTFGTPDGVLSYRHALTPGKRRTIDRALRIVGSRLREPGVCVRPDGAMADFLRLQFAGESCERFGVLFLDAQLCAIAFEIMFSGNPWRVQTELSEIARAALLHGASAVVLAHNHPQGDALPSPEDLDFTHQARTALGVLQIVLLDHLMVSGVSVWSILKDGAR